MVWYGMVWYGMVWYGMVWYGMVWYGMVWYGMVWYGMVWYVMGCTIMDNDSRITETIVYLYTYSSDNHLFKSGLLELNCNTLVKLRYRDGQHYSRILKVSSIAWWKGR